MKISEIFTSIQGEGPSVGKPSIFIRLSGCNLKCSFCDTKYALKNGEEWSWRKVAERVKLPFIRRIIWTGGEPALQMKEIVKVIGKLYKDDYNFSHEIETNGTINFKNIKLFDKIIISPKQDLIKEEIIRSFVDYPNVYWKFVVKNKKDFQFWNDFIDEYDLDLDKSKIYFMPIGTTNTELQKIGKWLVEYCISHNYNFSPRV